MDEQEKDSRPCAMKLDWAQHPEAVPSYIGALQSIIRRYQNALFFIHEHMEAGKAWDQECEKTIREALWPKPPERFAKRPEILRE